MDIRPLRHPADLDRLEPLFQRIAATDGHWPLGEQKYLALHQGGSEAAHRLVATAEGRPIAYLHLAPNQEPSGWGMELAIDPEFRTDDVLRGLITFAQDVVRAAGGGRLTLWLYNQEPPAVLVDAGFVIDRELHQLRRPLPVPERAQFPPEFVVRGFRPGVDDDQWLEVNNLAFAGHPENGNWTPDLFVARRSVDWFDPEGLRTVWAGDRMAAFNWTKMHADGTGEIYVIAVHPDFQGRGLGRAVALDGLAYLHDVRAALEASLYVDSSNERGLALYTSLGFTRDHTDRAFRWEP